MYIVVEHEISDPDIFWKTTQDGMADLPSNLTVHQVFPNREGRKAVCLWEADSVEEVESFIEDAVGEVSSNDYFAVESEDAVGLPTAARA